MPYLVGFPTPQDYGALGNGTNDDTAAINAALAAAPLGGVVYLPPGTYATSAPIMIPPQVALWGSHSSHLDSTTCSIKPLASFAGAAVILIVDQATGGYSVASNQQGLFFLTLDGSSLPGTTIDGILIQGFVHGLVMQDLQIKTMPNHGINATSNGSGFAYSWRGTRLAVQACLGYGYAVGGQTDTTWIDCEALGCQKSGWLFATQPSNTTLIACRSEYSNFNGFEFSGAWTGGNANGGCTLVGCTTDGNNRNGILSTATGDSPLEIIGGYFRRDGANGTAGGGSYAGIQVTGGTIPVTVDNPTVIPGIANSGGANSPQYGVSITSTSSNVAVSGGVLHAATTAWNDDGTNSNVRYGANILERVGTQASYTSTFNGLQTTRNAGYFVKSAQIGSGTDLGDNGVGELKLANATTVPTTNPTGGAIAYSRNGGLWARSTTGVVSPIVSPSEASYSPTGCLAETYPRVQSSSSAVAVGAITGTVEMVALWLPAGLPVTNINWVSGATAAVSPTHWWLGIADSGGIQRGHCADQLTGAIAGNTLFTKALTSQYVTTYTGLYYILISVTATTNPTSTGTAIPTNANLLTPLLAGVSSTTQSAPGTDGTTTYTVPAATNATGIAYAYLT